MIDTAKIKALLLAENPWGCGITPATNDGKPCQSCNRRAGELAAKIVSVLEDTP